MEGGVVFIIVNVGLLFQILQISLKANCACLQLLVSVWDLTYLSRTCDITMTFSWSGWEVSAVSETTIKAAPSHYDPDLDPVCHCASLRPPLCWVLSPSSSKASSFTFLLSTPFPSVIYSFTFLCSPYTSLLHRCYLTHLLHHRCIHLFQFICVFYSLSYLYLLYFLFGLLL